MLIIFWEQKSDDAYPVVGWVNRFANAGDAALEVAGNTAVRVRFALHHLSHNILHVKMTLFWNEAIL